MGVDEVSGAVYGVDDEGRRGGEGAVGRGFFAEEAGGENVSSSHNEKDSLGALEEGNALRVVRVSGFQRAGDHVFNCFVGLCYEVGSYNSPLGVSTDPRKRVES